jgi:CO dehydrogenase/acetyl-CoA synthase epsilon subunit
MGIIINDGLPYGGSSNNANCIKYDNSTSGMEAGNLQDAVDEINSNLFKYAKSADITVIPTGAKTQGTIDISAYTSTYSNIVAIIPYVKWFNGNVFDNVTFGGVSADNTAVSYNSLNGVRFVMALHILYN